MVLTAAKVVADSISPDGVRLTTIEVTFPRIVLAEFNTHRVFSRNSASSRAIPIGKRIKMVAETPYVPEQFGSNQKGMQSGTPLEGQQAEQARHFWLKASEAARVYAAELAELGVHKEYANRLLEPFCWHTVVVTATEWDNYWALRCHPLASPPIRKAAELMHAAREASQPIPINYGEWHLPYVEKSEAFDLLVGEHKLSMEDLVAISAARCARVSYLTHDGVRDPSADLLLYRRLASAGHMSPLEHPARPAEMKDLNSAMARIADVQIQSPSQHDEYLHVPEAKMWFGNFQGWVQHRKEIPGEAVFAPEEQL
jgi:hypothetical protein